MRQRHQGDRAREERQQPIGQQQLQVIVKVLGEVARKVGHAVVEEVLDRERAHLEAMHVGRLEHGLQPILLHHGHEHQESGFLSPCMPQEIHGDKGHALHIADSRVPSPICRGGVLVEDDPSCEDVGKHGAPAAVNAHAALEEGQRRASTVDVHGDLACGLLADGTRPMLRLCEQSGVASKWHSCPRIASLEPVLEARTPDAHPGSQPRARAWRFADTRVRRRPLY
mmetsp:Transcript_44808/g.124181  ORF Transcript_44808/g.124181 Transcript_44808/m.124181 type:complete len:226 (+) Transcript_44808:836-1513(+)